MEADIGWHDARLAFVTQISNWYAICNIEQFEGCKRQELKDDTEDEALERFQSEMLVALDRLKPFCSPGGRAGELGCIVGTGAWSPVSGAMGTMLQRLNTRVAGTMQLSASTTFRFLDFFSLGAAMPTETILGHGSQVLHTWAWQIMIAGLTDRTQAPQTMQQMVFNGSCSAANASLEDCQNYVKWCSPWDSCNLWMCMNSEKCDFEVLTMGTSSTGTTPMTATSTAPLAAGPVAAIAISVCCICALVVCCSRCLRNFGVDEEQRRKAAVATNMTRSPSWEHEVPVTTQAPLSLATGLSVTRMEEGLPPIQEESPETASMPTNQGQDTEDAEEGSQRPSFGCPSRSWTSYEVCGEDTDVDLETDLDKTLQVAVQTSTPGGLVDSLKLREFEGEDGVIISRL